jgi:hypothetical protein
VAASLETVASVNYCIWSANSLERHRLQEGAWQLVGDACGSGPIHTDNARCHLRDDGGGLRARHDNGSSAPSFPLPHVQCIVLYTTGREKL